MSVSTGIANNEKNERLRAKLLSNIPKLYGYCFFQMFLLLMPIIIPFWQSRGLTLQQIFSLQAVFGATLILFDVPAGYAADLFGRKRAMVVGSVISALGYLVLGFGHSFLHFAVYELVLGIGLSLQSGCDIAILYGTLETLQLEGRKAGYLGRRLMAQTLGEGTASLLGGLLAGFSLVLPVHLTAAASWITVLMAFSVYEPASTRLTNGTHLDNFRLIGRALFGHSRLLTLAILSFIFYGFATFCAVWCLQPYWQAKGIPISAFGYLWAVNCFMVALVGRYAHAIEEKIGSYAAVLTISLLPIVGYLGMGYTVGYSGLIFCLAFPVCRGLNQVIFSDAINARVPSEMRATTNSVGSLGMRALFIVFGPIVGRLLDSNGPTTALIFIGYVYVVGLFLIAMPLLRQEKGFQIQ